VTAVAPRAAEERVKPRVAVTLVCTTGPGSLDTYAWNLARHLDVPTVTVDMTRLTSDNFNVPFASRDGLRLAAADAALTARLARLAGPLHLPNQHLGRYALLLRQPFVITVHDLIRYRDARHGAGLIHRPSRWDSFNVRLDAVGIRRADAVITVSDAARREVIGELGLDAQRVFVVHEAVDHDLFRPVTPAELGFPYVLFVGSEHPRKNLDGVLRALALVRRDPRLRDVRLVKVGSAGGGEARFRARTTQALRELGLEDAVVFLEVVADEELVAYYSGAACTVLPSYYEGFGFPPLEAMACGCPAIVSSAGALPEIAGDAAVVVPPDDVHALAAAMKLLLTDSATRSDLRARGLARAAEFTWADAARETARVYDRLPEMARSSGRGRKRSSSGLAGSGSRAIFSSRSLSASMASSSFLRSSSLSSSVFRAIAPPRMTLSGFASRWRARRR
jgi:glycosyltransferase involved in cell wall biosynthesis